MEKTFIWNLFFESLTPCLCSGLACMPINTFLSKQYPYVFPESPSAAIFYIFISIRTLWFFHHHPHCSCIQVKRGHEPALCFAPGDGAFVSFNKDKNEAEYEAFRIPACRSRNFSFLNMVYADEGPEVVACTCINFTATDPGQLIFHDPTFDNWNPAVSAESLITHHTSLKLFASGSGLLKFCIQYLQQNFLFK